MGISANEEKALKALQSELDRYGRNPRRPPFGITRLQKSSRRKLSAVTADPKRKSLAELRLQQVDDLRQRGDYREKVVITREDVEPFLVQARNFIDAVRNLRQSQARLSVPYRIQKRLRGPAVKI